MKISANSWRGYISRLSKIDAKAAELMEQWIGMHGNSDTNALIEYAYGLVTKYGEATAALACEMYDATAAASGISAAEAIPAETATLAETARAINGTRQASPASIPSTVSRLVKQAGADTTLQNAARDGAQFAWIPHGDTCAFCLTLASRGWQYMGRNALKNGHAKHIHANCDCEYAVRFSASGGVAGYDPEQYREAYDNAEGSTPQEKINSLRRSSYALDKNEINARKRIAYQKRKSVEQSEKPAIIRNNKNIEDSDVQPVGSIDVEKYKCVTPDIQTDDVVITDERIVHIQERHPNDYERFVSYIPEIVGDPDYILEANKPNTAVILKEVTDHGEKFKLILRLKVETDPETYKNSVLSFWHIGDTTWRKTLKNKNILYKKE